MKIRTQLLIIVGLGVLVLGVLLVLSLQPQQQTISTTPVASLQSVTPTATPTPTEFVPTQKPLGPSEITVTPPGLGEPTLPPDALAMHVASTATSSPIPPSLTPTPTASPTVTPIAITSQDDVPMVQIPAGEFIMGISHPQVGQWFGQHSEIQFLTDDFAYVQTPQLTVRLDAYAIDKFEVTIDRYRRCVQAGICQSVSALQTLPDNYPVVGVTWDDADTYCRWVGKHLPNEAEWEKAARGTDGRWYPWGNDWAENRAKEVDTPQDLRPVGSYPEGASPYGLLDMGGNASEWTNDWFDPYPEQPDMTLFSGYHGQERVIRGWLRGSYSLLGGPKGSAVARIDNLPNVPPPDFVGFRCGRGPIQDWHNLVIHTSLSSAVATLTLDLSKMVYVPAGEFIMGTNDKKSSYAQPAHIVYLDEYYIDKYEVTVPEFAAFLNGNSGHSYGCGGYSCSGFDRYGGTAIPGLSFVDGQYQIKPEAQHWPASDITWYGAQAYCAWAGKRLPTEAEWEKAARGTDGRKYPWGNDWNPDWAAGMYFPRESPLASVGQYPKDTSPYGAMDMLGNVEEWVFDWFDRNYYAQAPYANPVNRKSSGQGWVVRGRVGPISQVGLTLRTLGVPASGGFRCVYTPASSR